LLVGCKDAMQIQEEGHGRDGHKRSTIVWQSIADMVVEWYADRL
jgi:hypothetical protein